MTLREKTLRAKLKAAKAELTIRRRNFNAAYRAHARAADRIFKLEKQLERFELA